MISKTTFEATNSALMRELGFSHKDLDANRDGMLTDRQRRQVSRWQLWKSGTLWFLAVCLACPFTQIHHFPHWPPMAKAGMLLWFGVVLVLVGNAFSFQRQTFRVLAAGQVMRTRGPIRRTAHFVPKGESYYAISTPGKELKVSEKIYGSFCEGKTYTLYYLPEIDYVLSAEFHPLPEPESAPISLSKRSGKAS
jgi:hypothetical protein